MATTTLTDTLTAEPATGLPAQIGDSDHRRTPDEAATFRVTCEHPPTPKEFVRFGEVWVTPCGRCGAKGNVGFGPFGGICYTCNGSGVHGESYTTEELHTMLNRWATRSIAASKKAAKKIAAATAEREAWRASHAGLVAWAQELEPARVWENDHSYTQIEDTREAAETGQGYSGERLARTEQMEDGRWWALFVIDTPVFDQFGTKAHPMIETVRAGGMLDKRETAYLNRVRETALKEAAERAPQIAIARHAGNPDTRMTVTGQVVFVKELEDEGRGARRMVIVEGTGADEGITWKTWTGARTVWDVIKGDAVRVTATIRHNGEYKGVKNDSVVRPVFVVVPQDEEADDPEETPAAPVAEGPQASPAPRARGGRRAALGESVVPGWEVLYDKPRDAAQVVRHVESGRPGLVCTRHAHVHELARQADEGKVRKAGGWCPGCAA